MRNDFTEWIVGCTHMQMSVHRDVKLLSESLPGVLPLLLSTWIVFPAFIRFLRKCFCDALTTNRCSFGHQKNLAPAHEFCIHTKELLMEIIFEVIKLLECLSRKVSSS